MKQAVIKAGGKQHLVSVGQTLDVELTGEGKTLTFESLLAIDGAKVQVGQPIVKGVTVKAEVIETIKAPKVRIMKFKAKKRVRKLTGHRQRYSRIKITSIS